MRVCCLKWNHLSAWFPYCDCCNNQQDGLMGRGKVTSRISAVLWQLQEVLVRYLIYAFVFLLYFSFLSFLRCFYPIVFYLLYRLANDFIFSLVFLHLVTLPLGWLCGNCFGVLASFFIHGLFIRNPLSLFRKDWCLAFSSLMIFLRICTKFDVTFMPLEATPHIFFIFFGCLFGLSRNYYEIC